MNSPWLAALLQKEIGDRIDRDPRTMPGTFLGWRKDTIFTEVIGGGQADFDARIGHLNGFDRALLYARYNQQGHLDELDLAFRQLFQSHDSQGRGLTVLDLGCGPFTAGLALANVFGSGKQFRYFGIDISASMLALADVLATGARECGALHPATSITFLRTLDGVDAGPVRSDLTLVVASYLLASNTLSVTALVDDVLRATQRIGPGPVAVIYTNSARDSANRNYPLFKQQLGVAGFDVPAEGDEYFTGTRNARRIRYALFFRAEQVRIDLGVGR